MTTTRCASFFAIAFTALALAVPGCAAGGASGRSNDLEPEDPPGVDAGRVPPGTDAGRAPITQPGRDAGRPTTTPNPPAPRVDAGPPDRTPNPANDPTCPDIVPDNPIGSCVGTAIYASCKYGNYTCLCDWIHWLCI